MLKNNIALKVMAVLFAVFLWWIVVNIDDPVDDKVFNVDVAVTNPDVITNAGKTFQIADNTKSVTVTVKGRRKVLSGIKKNNVIATADLREMQDSSVPVRVTIDGFEGAYEEASAKPRNIQVIVENIQKKTFPVTAVSTGTPRSGYVVGNMTVEPKTVDISGPESLIQKISKVTARVDVDELSSDKDIRTDLLYYDAADNLLDKSRATSNCDKNGVTVKVDLWRTKKVSLEFDTSGIRTATGYTFTGIEVEPESVEVAGDDELLVVTNRIVIGREALERSGLSSKEQVLVDITKYLPEGLILAGDNAGKVAVNILVEENKSEIRSIRFLLGKIQTKGLPDSFTAAFEKMVERGELDIELHIAGPAELRNAVNADQLEVIIDLTDGKYHHEGDFEVPVSVMNLPDGCTYAGNAFVTVTIKKKT